MLKWETDSYLTYPTIRIMITKGNQRELGRCDEQLCQWLRYFMLYKDLATSLLASHFTWELDGPAWRLTERFQWLRWHTLPALCRASSRPVRPMQSSWVPSRSSLLRRTPQHPVSLRLYVSALISRNSTPGYNVHNMHKAKAWFPSFF